MQNQGDYFRAWVRHFRRFTSSHRGKIADWYGLEESSAESIARALCEQPSILVNSVHETLRDAEAWEILRELALQHDLVVSLRGTTRKARKTLFDMGMLLRVESREATLPAAAGAILAPLLPARTTFPTLLGALSDEELRTIASTWDVHENSSRIGLVLAVSERLAEPGLVDELLERMPEIDYLGAALVAIELGGVCYWQEVFGYDMKEQSAESKVVPFMRSDERATEEDMALTLQHHGVIFRIDEMPHPMLAVPEELWQPIWSLGRTWLADWVHEVYLNVEASGARKPAEDESRYQMQAVLKWLTCESHRSEIEPETLRQKTQMDEDEFDAHFVVAREASIFSSSEDRLFDRVLDLPHQAFSRQVLSEWSAGYIGAHADERLAAAFGLDETWRTMISDEFSSRGEFLPRWMAFEGIESEMTGAGTLRLVAEDDPFELLADEFAATNRIVRLSKLIFLDLGSTLSQDYFYPRAALAELLQISCAFAVFASTLYALEDSRAPLYIPLQRASFLNDAYHAEYFETWFEDILESLLIPLGVAHRARGDEGIRLETASLRLSSPADTTDHARRELMRELLHDPELDLSFPTLTGGQLREVPDFGNSDRIEIAAPIQVLRDWLGDREIVEFDGRELSVEP